MVTPLTETGITEEEQFLDVSYRISEFEMPAGLLEGKYPSIN